jgi:predicted Zn-dependent protease
LALALAGISAGAQQPSQGVNLYSKEKEAALGAVLAEDLRKETKPLASDTVRAYVERLGARLAAQAPEGSGPYRFEVVADDTWANAVFEPVALPGGYIFVRAGLLLAARDEAEFAGMLAHSVAHVAARHETRQRSRQQIAQTITRPLAFSSPPVMGTGPTEMQVLLPTMSLAFARGYELEADLMAVPIMAGAGYDPSALASYIQRVQVDSPGSTVMSSPLPPRDKRVAALQEAIASLPAREYSAGPDFARIQEEVRGLTQPTP